MRNSRIVRSLALAVAATLPVVALAQTSTWSNGAGGTWNTPGNWDTLPTIGTTTSLVFGLGGGYTATNNFPGGFTGLSNLTFSSTGTVTLAGNPISLGGTITHTNGSANITSAFTLTSTTTLSGTSTGNVTFSGGLNTTAPALPNVGPGTGDPAIGLIKNSTGGLRFTGGTNSLGFLQTNAGLLTVTGSTTVLNASSLAVPDIGETPYDNDLGVSIAHNPGSTASAIISGGAVVNAVNFYMAAGAGSTSTLTVTGEGTKINSVFPNGPGEGHFAVGRGNATINIEAGADVDARFSDFPREYGGSATINVTGAGSTFTTGQIVVRGGDDGDGPIEPPFGGNFEMNITNGGAVVVEARGGLNGLFNISSPGNTGTDDFEANLTINNGSLSTGGLIAARDFQSKSTLSFTNATVTNSVFGTSANQDSVTTLTMSNNSTMTTDGVITGWASVDQNFSAGDTFITIDATSSINGVQNFIANDSDADDIININGGTFATVAGDLDADGNDDSQLVIGLAGFTTSTININNGGSMPAAGATFMAIGADSTHTVNVNSGSFSSDVGLILGGSGGTEGGTVNLNINGPTSSASGAVGTIIYGGVTIALTNGGTLNTGGLSTGGTLDTGTVTSTGGVINLNGDIGIDSLTFDAGLTVFSANFYTSVLTGTGTLNKSGAAVQILSNATSSFGGAVNITAGSLVVLEPTFTATTDIVNSSAGATLDFLDGTTGEPTGEQVSFAGLEVTVGAPVTYGSITEPGAVAAFTGVTFVGAQTALTVGTLHQGSIQIGAGSSITVAPNGTPTPEGTIAIAGLVSFTDPAEVLPDGTLFTSDNDLIIDYTGASPYILVRDEFLLGLTSGAPVIVPTGTDSLGNTTILALFEASDLGLTAWNGMDVDADALIGKYTYAGDANLDGQVDAFDYSVVDDNFGSSGVTFALGDLNADGVVDAFDYSSIDDSFGFGIGNPLRPAANSEVFIPEPSSLGFLALAGGLLARRRRA